MQIKVDVGQGAGFLWVALFLDRTTTGCEIDSTQVELSASINMAPSMAVSSHPYVGRMADTPAKQEASLCTENTIYVAFYMVSCFLYTHTLAHFSG